MTARTWSLGYVVGWHRRRDESAAAARHRVLAAVAMARADGLIRHVGRDFDEIDAVAIAKCLLQLPDGGDPEARRTWETFIDGRNADSDRAPGLWTLAWRRWNGWLTWPAVGGDGFDPWASVPT